MTKAALIKKTVKVLNTLTADKAKEVADFAEYIRAKQDDSELQTGIQTLVDTSEAFRFLHNEEDIYSMNDLKEKFNA